MWDVLSGVAEVAWDVLSGAAKMAWDVLSGVTKTAWDVLSGVAKNGMGCFVLHSAVYQAGHVYTLDWLPDLLIHLSPI